MLFITLPAQARELIPPPLSETGFFNNSISKN